MDRFIALDCGAKTGWAWGDKDRVWKSGVWKAPKDAKQSESLNTFRYWLSEIVRVNSIGRVYFEEPIMPRATGKPDGRGGVVIMQHTTFQTVTSLVGYGIVIGLISDDLGVPCYAINQSTWRSELGVPVRCPPKVKAHLPKTSDAARKWVKRQTWDKVISLGHNALDDNESDGLGLFLAMQARMQRKGEQPSFFDDMVQI